LQKQIDELKAAIVNTRSNVSSLSSTKIPLTDAALEQNVPNPFSNATTIHYTLPQKFTKAQIIITDKNGKLLKQVNVSRIGEGILNVNAATLSLGAYDYSLIVDGRVISSKHMILTK
jgi:hypothetical protein